MAIGLTTHQTKQELYALRETYWNPETPAVLLRVWWSGLAAAPLPRTSNSRRLIGPDPPSVGGVVLRCDLMRRKRSLTMVEIV